MDLGLAIAFALAFALTNGFHDAANAIATLVATRGARPGQAIALSAVFNMLGALLVGTAVADTIAGIVTVAPRDGGRGDRLRASWRRRSGTSLTWWRGLPSSSGHALVGGLVGAALADGGIGRGPLGRPRRLAAGRRLRRADRARRLARCSGSRFGLLALARPSGARCAAPRRASRARSGPASG